MRGAHPHARIGSQRGSLLQLTRGNSRTQSRISRRGRGAGTDPDRMENVGGHRVHRVPSSPFSPPARVRTPPACDSPGPAADVTRTRALATGITARHFHLAMGFSRDRISSPLAKRRRFAREHAQHAFFVPAVTTSRARPDRADEGDRERGADLSNEPV